jgi:ubiquinone/menaquinone biosynthesis C-methylase UbiE
MYPALAMANAMDGSVPVGETPHELAEVVAYYTRVPETERLPARAGGALEFARTQELLLRHLPPVPATVLDIGGGTGPYARWLAGLGYRVCLLDLVPAHVAEAALTAWAGTAPAGIVLGNALSLPFADARADVVLLLGPLYHLTRREQRLQALREAFRVLKPGGRLFAVAVSRFASLIDGLHFGFLTDPDFRLIVERDLHEGQHRGLPIADTVEQRRVPDASSYRSSSERDPTMYWTTAYFHRPDELAAEVAEAGFSVLDQIAVEGPYRVVPDLAAWWNDEPRRTLLLETIRAVEHEPSLLGLSSHILVVGERPGPHSP